MAAEDVAQFDGDDPYDGQRYGIDEAEQFFVEAAEEFVKIENREAIISRLGNTNNWTMFYRSLEKLEENEKQEQGPVRRYRRH